MNISEGFLLFLSFRFICWSLRFRNNTGSLQLLSNLHLLQYISAQSLPSAPAYYSVSFRLLWAPVLRLICFLRLSGEKATPPGGEDFCFWPARGEWWRTGTKFVGSTVFSNLLLGNLETNDSKNKLYLHFYCWR